MQKMQPIRAFVDRIEGKMAVLLLGEDESVKVDIPIAWLPNGIKEGTVLRLSLDIDSEVTEAGKRRVQSLMDSLGNEP